MSKTPFLGLRDNRLRTRRSETLEANLPVSRPTSSPQCTFASGTIQPLVHACGGGVLYTDGGTHAQDPVVHRGVRA